MSDDAQSPPTTSRPLDEVGGRALVEAWLSSGLSGAAFCRQRNLRAQRLNYWRERLGYPIKVVRADHRLMTAAAPPTEGFVQMVVGTPIPAPTSHVDIVVGTAVVRVRAGFDPTLLREVVCALSASA